MEILGIGPMELILILIVALMVFGPDKLPTIGAKLGRAMRDMRKATRAISSEINATREALEAEAKPITDPIKDVTDAAKAAGSLVSVARNPGQALKDSVMKELNPPPAEEQTGDEAAPAEPVNVIAPPGLTQAAADAESPAPPEVSPAEPAALPVVEETPLLAAPEPLAVEALPPAVEAEPLAPEALDTGAPTPAEPPADAAPAPKKRKPRARKAPIEPAGDEPLAGEQ